MSPIQKTWDLLAARYAALSRRERVLIATGLVIGPLLIGYSLFLDPLAAQKKSAMAEIGRLDGELSELRVHVVSLQSQLQNDPDAGRKAELAALRGEREKLDQQLQDIGSKLVRPQEMNALLEHFLTRQAGLRLLSLKTFAPESVLAPKAKEGDATTVKPAQQAFDLYRHGVEIRLEGGYGELRAYVEQLEAAPQRLLWGKLDYRVIEYPRAEMRVVVYTLSPERAWLAM